MKSIAIASVALSCILAIFYFSLIQADTLELFYQWIGIGNDTFLHVLSFFLLSCVIRLMLSTRFFRGLIQKPGAWSAGIAMSLSVIIETVQLVTTTRHGLLRDLWLHAAGIMLFLVCDLSFEKKSQSFDPIGKDKWH
ncbi:MAG: hypothetical protein AB7S77_12905 [Desulfatirhabdiaceae bacterium]